MQGEEKDWVTEGILTGWLEKTWLIKQRLKRSERKRN